jgi:hypothetical protein
VFFVGEARGGSWKGEKSPHKQKEVGKCIVYNRWNKVNEGESCICCKDLMHFHACEGGYWKEKKHKC